MRAPVLIKPFKFALDLHGEFTGGAWGARRGFLGEAFGLAEKGCGDGQAIDRDAGRSPKPRDRGLQPGRNGKLDRGGVFIFALGEGARR
jgi:hypothetical protein